MPAAGYGGTAEQSMANANLIAAAPELLEELEKHLTWLRHVKPQITAIDSVMIGFDQSIKYIELAINKARGQV